MGQTILLIGHGSRDPEGKREFADLVVEVRAAIPELAVAAGVLEFADATTPSVDEAIDRCAASGANALRVVPILLHTAMHSRSDVPEVVARGADRHQGLALEVAPPLATEESLLDVLEERIRAAEMEMPMREDHETAIVLVGRGSHNVEANAEFLRTGQRFAERCGGRPVICSFVSLAQPDVPTALDACVRRGARRVLVAPYFVNTGLLVKRIAFQVAEVQARHPEVELIVTGHLGVHPKLVDLIRARALAGEEPCGHTLVVGGHAEPVALPAFPLLARYGLGPAETEALSLRRVEEALRGVGSWSELEAEIVRRIVYAGGDPELAQRVRIHPDAIHAGIAALRAGEPILTDVRMVAVALDRTRSAVFGAPIRSAIDVPGAAEQAQRHGLTRTAAGMAMLADGLAGGIVVVGNAPTALLVLLDLVDAGRARPALIIGTPVGFVAASESKAELAARMVPFITIDGTRGGSAVGAAALNALLRLAGATPDRSPA